MKQKPADPCRNHVNRPEFGCEQCIQYVRRLQADAAREDELAAAPTQRILIEWRGTVSLSGTVIYEAPVPAGWDGDAVWEVYEAELNDLVNTACEDALSDAYGDTVDWEETTTIGPVVEPPRRGPDPGQPTLLGDVS